MNLRPCPLPDDVGDRVAGMGISGHVSNVTFGRWGKILATVTDSGGARRRLKMSHHGYGRHLLRQEARGYRELAPTLSAHYRFPRFSLVHDGNGHTVALMTEIEGRRLRAWQLPEKPITALAGACRTVAFETWAQSLLAPLARSAARERLEACAERLASRGACHRLALGPSHGDFSPWNVFRSRSASPALAILDFEYYSPARPLLFDDWHWIVGTFARRVLRHRLAALAPALIDRLPGLLWNTVLRARYAGFAEVQGDRPGNALKLYLSAYLLEQGAILLREQGIEGSRTLLGPHDFLLRSRLIRLFGRLLDRLSR